MVYNQTLRAMGDNDFNVAHTGVTARQRAGTLEREVKYDQEAFKKAWDYLAAPPVTARKTNRLFLFFFPHPFFCPASVLVLVWFPQVY